MGLSKGRFSHILFIIRAKARLSLGRPLRHIIYFEFEINSSAKELISDRLSLTMLPPSEMR